MSDPIIILVLHADTVLLTINDTLSLGIYSILHLGEFIFFLGHSAWEGLRCDVACVH